MKKRWMLVLFLGLSLAGAGSLIADDDDDEHEEHEHEDRSGWAIETRGADIRRLPPADNAAWREECAACHLLYPPGLLPVRSWAKLMTGLDKHFGENASLDPQTRAEITAFLIDNAAERMGGRRGSKIASSIPPGETPIAFSETYYFKRKHHEISAAVFKRPAIGSPGKCNACHADAEKGIFDEERVKIPR